MNYEKKYKNALEWARQVMTGETGFIRKEVEEVFPELAESEDERIRKAMLKMVQETPNNLVWADYGFSKKEALTWLEKQGKQSLAWSEEDETGLTNTIIMLKEGASLHFNKKDITKAVNWLKSLRPQNRWKPSDEQMKLLKELVEDNNQRYFYTTLRLLYEQLKSLKGE